MKRSPSRRPRLTNRRGVAAASVAATLLAGAVVLGAGAHEPRLRLPIYRDSTFAPAWLTARAAAAPDMHRVAPFEVLDQHGRTVTEHAFGGHVTIVHFFFTACGDICPTTTRSLARVLDSLRDDRVQVISYSVASGRDSVPALQEFASRHGITDPRWHLVTGTRSAIERLARASFFLRLGDGWSYGVATIAHTETVLVVDSDRRLRGVYAGTLRMEMERLVEDVRTLLQE